MKSKCSRYREHFFLWLHEGAFMERQIRLTDDFSEPLFQAAFQTYFDELEITVTDWDGLWKEMNGGENRAYLVLEDDRAIGFLQFTEIELSNWFFTQRLGFIREFWVDEKHRGMGIGTQLLALTEKHFLESGLSQAILTTESAKEFYTERGYVKAGAIKAANQQSVYVKELAEGGVAG